MATFDYLLGQLRTNEFKRPHTAGGNVALTPQNASDYFTIGDTGGVDDLINSLGSVITAMFISPNTTGINFFANMGFGNASFLPIGGAFIAGHAGGTATTPLATPALSNLGVFTFFGHDDGFWAANSANNYAVVPGVYGKALTQPVSNSYDFQGWLGSLLYQHFTWTAPASGALTAKINEGNNTMTTTIGSAGGTAATVDGTGGGLAISSFAAVNGLSVDSTGSSGDGLVVKATTNTNTFQYKKSDGTNLLRGTWDTGNFHQYLGGSLYYNLSGNNFVIDGNGYSNTGLIISDKAELKLDSSIDNSAPNIRIGGGSYATAGVPLTTTNVYWNTAWAWNGSNGYTLSSQTTLNHVMLSTTNGDSELRFINNSSATVLALGMLNKTATFGGSVATPYAAKTSTYPITASDSVIDCTANSFTVTLPTAVGCAGRQYVIKNSGTGTITIATTSSQTIDGSTTITISVQNTSITVVSDGANWKII